jgi:hypothetical protein
MCTFAAMRIDILQIAGPVPVKREAALDSSALPAAAQKSFEKMLRSATTGESSAARLPDVGTCRVRVTQDDGSTLEFRFSEAEATADQMELLRALRPFLKVTPWK